MQKLGCASMEKLGCALGGSDAEAGREKGCRNLDVRWRKIMQKCICLPRRMTLNLGCALWRQEGETTVPQELTSCYWSFPDVHYVKRNTSHEVLQSYQIMQRRKYTKSWITNTFNIQRLPHVSALSAI
jgi:hypothetical protein